jgi:transposase
MTDISPRTPCSDRSALQRVPLIGTKATADFHQGAQRSCCKSDAVYMAAAEITPASPEKPLPRGSHPYTVRGQSRASLLEGAAGIFERGGKAASAAEVAEETVRELHAKIGELAVANDFLSRKLKPWTRK